MSDERGADGHIGDAALEAAWRAASTEQPAAHADEAILAAARSAVRPDAQPPRHRRAMRWWTHWQPLAAAAGVAGLAFLLVPRLPTERSIPEELNAPTEVAVPGVPAPAALPETDTAASAAATTEPAAAARDLVKPVRNRSPDVRATSEASTGTSVEPPVADESAGPPIPAAPSGELPREAAEAFPRESTDRTESRQAAPAQEALTPLLHEHTAGMAAAKSVSDAAAPEAWVQRIVSLHEGGNLSAATTELRAFREAYPDADARLPARLRAWAKTVDSGEDVR